MSTVGIQLPTTRSCLNRSAIHWASFLSFFSTDSLNIFGMSKDNRTVIFQDVINRNPVFTCGFHTDILAIPFE